MENVDKVSSCPVKNLETHTAVPRTPRFVGSDFIPSLFHCAAFKTARVLMQLLHLSA